MKFGAEKIELVILIPQKIVLVMVDEKKYPKKIEFNPQNVKKGGQNGGTSISPNIEGVPSLGTVIGLLELKLWVVRNGVSINTPSPGFHGSIHNILSYLIIKLNMCIMYLTHSLDDF